MANNYYSMTGTLTAKKLTPVLSAIFQGLNIDQYGDSDVYYIAQDEDTSSPYKEDLLESLSELVETLKESSGDSCIEDEYFEEESESGGKECIETEEEDAESVDEDDFEKVVFELANLIKLSAEKQEQLGAITERLKGYDDYDDIEVDTLYELASCLDDGHGLSEIATEASWYCTKPRLFEFGGAGYYESSNLTMHMGSVQPRGKGPEVDKHIKEGDFESAAKVYAKIFKELLDGIKDAELKGTLTEMVASELLK